MGCDIHTYLEKFVRINNEEKWVQCDYFERNEWYVKPARPFMNDEQLEERKYHIVHFYHDRDYELFTILAGVRAQSGTRIICQPRGLPTDVSPEIQKISDDWGYDGHSHSWFTLQELIDQRNNYQMVKKKGWVSQSAKERYEKWSFYPRPYKEHWTPSHYHYMEWTENFDGFEKFVRNMKRRFDETWKINDPNCFRTVFWFDN